MKKHQRLCSNDRQVLSVMGLDTDHTALSRLRKLAERASGSFINLRQPSSGTEVLLGEVNARSRW